MINEAKIDATDIRVVGRRIVMERLAVGNGAASEGVISDPNLICSNPAAVVPSAVAGGLWSLGSSCTNSLANLHPPP
jgi:hypothetical protein